MLITVQSDKEQESNSRREESTEAEQKWKYYLYSMRKLTPQGVDYEQANITFKTTNPQLQGPNVYE